jgi:hypothetical protein
MIRLRFLHIHFTSEGYAGDNPWAAAGPGGKGSYVANQFVGRTGRWIGALFSAALCAGATPLLAGRLSGVLAL